MTISYFNDCLSRNDGIISRVLNSFYKLLMGKGPKLFLKFSNKHSITKRNERTKEIKKEKEFKPQYFSLESR